MIPTAVILKAKLLIVDGETVLFGSANMDLRSLFVNFEIGLVAYSPAEAAAVKTGGGGASKNFDKALDDEIPF